MRISLLHNHFDEKKLEEIIREMETLGAPTIRVYDTEVRDEYHGNQRIYQAIEGSHRLRACEELGIEPVIVVLDGNTLIESLDLDTDGEGSINSLGDYENYKITV